MYIYTIHPTTLFFAYVRGEVVLLLIGKNVQAAAAKSSTKP